MVAGVLFQGDIMTEEVKKTLTGVGQFLLNLIVDEMEFGDLGVAYVWPEGLAAKLDGAL